MMINNRIFTFGCSFTSYSWPTWADMLLYENKGINYGRCGGGFDQILNNLIQCDMDYNLTTDDIVIIVYPNLIRWDGPFYPNMINYGNAQTSKLKKYENILWTIDGLIYKNTNIIYMIDEFLQHKKVTYRYSSILDIFACYGNYFEDISIQHKLKDYIDKIQEKINFITNFAKFTNNEVVWKTTKKWKGYDDTHPRPLEHYNWLIDVLLPTIDVNINIDKNMVIEMENQLNKFNIQPESELYFYQKNYFNNRFSND